LLDGFEEVREFGIDEDEVVYFFVLRRDSSQSLFLFGNKAAHLDNYFYKYERGIRESANSITSENQGDMLC
jgi:hypothetical protein